MTAEIPAARPLGGLPPAPALPQRVEFILVLANQGDPKPSPLVGPGAVLAGLPVAGGEHSAAGSPYPSEDRVLVSRSRSRTTSPSSCPSAMPVTSGSRTSGVIRVPVRRPEPSNDCRLEASTVAGYVVAMGFGSDSFSH